jgi:hypothetical protein
MTNQEAVLKTQKTEKMKFCRVCGKIWDAEGEEPYLCQYTDEARNKLIEAGELIEEVCGSHMNED